jgi:hypothetical protein
MKNTAFLQALDDALRLGVVIPLNVQGESLGKQHILCLNHLNRFLRVNAVAHNQHNWAGVLRPPSALLPPLPF